MMKRIATVLTMLGVCTSLAISQQPTRPSREVLITPKIGQPEIQRAQVMLKAIESTQNNPALLKQLLDLVQKNPGKSPEQLANEFVKQNPQFNNRESTKQFEKLAESLQQFNPSKTTPKLPNINSGQNQGSKQGTTPEQNTQPEQGTNPEQGTTTKQGTGTTTKQGTGTTTKQGTNPEQGTNPNPNQGTKPNLEPNQSTNPNPNQGTVPTPNPNQGTVPTPNPNQGTNPNPGTIPTPGTNPNSTQGTTPTPGTNPGTNPNSTQGTVPTPPVPNPNQTTTPPGPNPNQTTTPPVPNVTEVPNPDEMRSTPMRPRPQPQPQPQPTAQPTPSTQRSEQERQFQAVAGWWEKNVGPLEKTPGIKEVLTEFVKGVGSDDGKSPLSNFVSTLEGKDKGSIGNWMESNLKNNNWKLPELGGTKGAWKPDMSGLTAPSLTAPSADFGFDTGDANWTPMLLLVLLMGALIVGWRLWPMFTGRVMGRPVPLAGLGPWPIDPRKIANRDNLIVAFEYLSVLSCGYGAKNWNHITIANELRRVVPQADPIADELGELYALARYTPDDESLPEHVIPDARRYLCQLAGVRS